VFTPNALAIAPLATEAKIPFLVINAGTSVVTTRSPYIVRDSFTLWQSSYPLGQWAAKKYKRAYTLVSDYGPGHDAEAAFTEAFKAGGGQLVGSVRVPLQNPDFAPYMQRVKDAKPDALMVFIPAGKDRDIGDEDVFRSRLAGCRRAPHRPGRYHHRRGAAEHGRRRARRDDCLPLLGGGRPAREQTLRGSLEEGVRRKQHAQLRRGRRVGCDGDDLYRDPRAEGKLDPERTLDIFKHWKNPDSPRGPISIDPETRDIVQNEYLRKCAR